MKKRKTATVNKLINTKTLNN